MVKVAGEGGSKEEKERKKEKKEGAKKKWRTFLRPFSLAFLSRLLDFTFFSLLPRQ